MQVTVLPRPRNSARVRVSCCTFLLYRSSRPASSRGLAVSTRLPPERWRVPRVLVAAAEVLLPGGRASLLGCCGARLEMVHDLLA